MTDPLEKLLASALNHISTITPTELQQQREEGSSPLIVDLREPDELLNGSLLDAIHIPRGQLELKLPDVVMPTTQHQPIVLYCAAGTRSALAALTLHHMGYTQVNSLTGGFSAWKEMGLPFEIKTLLSSESKARYARHISIPEVGEEGQQKLLNAKVLMVGAGGLGSPAALYLAAAGVGTLGIIDFDRVDRSNLQRQILHTDQSVGEHKTTSAKATLHRLNPDVQVKLYTEKLDASNVHTIFQDTSWDVIIDGGDNFATRYLVNDMAQNYGIAVIHGSIARFKGQLTTFLPHTGPCYRCLYPEPPEAGSAPTCQEAGVLGVLPGIVGTLQATEALKLILGLGESLHARLLLVDALSMNFRTLKLTRDPHCKVCS